jgi:lysophospholipase L1-like esterase
MKKLTTAMVAGIALVALVAPMSASAAPPELKVVAMGDSSASGTGAGDYQAGTGVSGDCFRSANSYSSVLVAGLKAKGRRVTLNEVACSGAKVADLRQPFRGQPAQVDSLQSDTGLVTLTIGGNDIGLAEFGGACVQSDCTGPATDAVLQRLDAMRRDVRKLLTEIRSRSPRARIIVTGYGRQFTPGDNASGVTLDPICGPAVLTAPERTVAERVSGSLDFTLRAASVGLATYVSEFAVPGILRPEFADHSLCEAGPSYYRGFDALAPGQEGQEAVLHLNKAGHAALGAVIERLLRCI